MGMSIQHQGMYTRLFEKRSGMGTGVYTIRVFEEGYVYGYEYTASGYVCIPGYLKRGRVWVREYTPSGCGARSCSGPPG